MKRILIVLFIVLASLVCSAQAATPAPVPVHGVTLTWTNAIGSTPTGFYIFRSTTAGGPYTAIAQVPATSLTFTDLNVTANGTYYYVLAAFTTQGTFATGTQTLTSVFSAEVKVVIPPDPILPGAPSVNSLLTPTLVK